MQFVDDIESCVKNTKTDTEKALQDLKEVAAARNCNAFYVLFAILAAFTLYLLAI